MGKNLVHMCQNYVNKYEKANAAENLTHKFSDHQRGKLVPSSISQRYNSLKLDSKSFCKRFHSCHKLGCQTVLHHFQDTADNQEALKQQGTKNQICYTVLSLNAIAISEFKSAQSHVHRFFEISHNASPLPTVPYSRLRLPKKWERICLTFNKRYRAQEEKKNEIFKLLLMSCSRI